MARPVVQDLARPVVSAFVGGSARAQAPWAAPDPKVPSMQALLITVALLLGSVVVIYVTCEYFVNGVEWVGHKLEVGQQATGSILAALGTALPESVVTFVAVVFGDDVDQKAIGIAAALGAHWCWLRSPMTSWD